MDKLYAHGVVRRSRIIFIRHAESGDNVVQNEIGEQLARGEISVAQAARLFHERRYVDAPLSAKGVAQANAMAQGWAGAIAALRPPARLYCSAMLRSLQTAQPLRRALGALDARASGGHAATTVTVHPDLFEAQGLVPKGDDVHAPAGMSGAEITQQFGGCFDASLLPPRGPWCPGGYERRAAQLARARRVREWLVDRARRDALRTAEAVAAAAAPVNGTHVLVCHADFMGLLMRELLGNPLAGPKDRSGPAFSFTNTGVSSILLDGTTGDVTVEFLDRVEHVQELDRARDQAQLQQQGPGPGLGQLRSVHMQMPAEWRPAS